MPSLFDPLRALCSMHVEVFIGDDGRVYLRFDRRHTNANKDEAREVAGRWGRVLRLQLENGDASVQKLIAHGKLKAGDVRDHLG